MSNTHLFAHPEINQEVMVDTGRCYTTMPELKHAVRNSISQQFMVKHEQDIRQREASDICTEYICSGKRTLEAAAAHKGLKTAVLNFANNHAIGGSPFYAGAQEESICRCSTLYPCLQAMKDEYYDYHINLFHRRELDDLGNDDLIYTPDVVVFKSDERTEPIRPQMMPEVEWYKVNVITCAAPEMLYFKEIPNNYKNVIRSRIRKILDVAYREGNKVLILGAWGCGAFQNPPEVVAEVFAEELKHYDFSVVEFALGTTKPLTNNPFYQTLENNINFSPKTIEEKQEFDDQLRPVFEEYDSADVYQSTRYQYKDNMILTKSEHIVKDGSVHYHCFEREYEDGSHWAQRIINVIDNSVSEMRMFIRPNGDIVWHSKDVDKDGHVTNELYITHQTPEGMVEQEYRDGHIISDLLNGEERKY